VERIKEDEDFINFSDDEDQIEREEHDQEGGKEKSAGIPVSVGSLKRAHPGDTVPKASDGEGGYLADDEVTPPLTKRF